MHDNIQQNVFLNLNHSHHPYMWSFDDYSYLREMKLYSGVLTTYLVSLYSLQFIHTLC